MVVVTPTGPPDKYEDIQLQMVDYYSRYIEMGGTKYNCTVAVVTLVKFIIQLWGVMLGLTVFISFDK